MSKEPRAEPQCAGLFVRGILHMTVGEAAVVQRSGVHPPRLPPAPTAGGFFMMTKPERSKCRTIRCLFGSQMRAGCDSRQQTLCLGDLGHLGRWRKAFERRPEDGAGFSGVAGRVVELGKRERRT